MFQTFPGGFIDVQGDKNTSGDKKTLGLTFGNLFPGPRMTPKRVIGYLFKYMTQLLPSNRLWLCEAQKTRTDKKVWDLPRFN